MKLLVGNGKQVEIYDLGPLLYKMKIKDKNGMINLHGLKMLDNESARQFIRDNKHQCNCENKVKKNDRS